APPCLYPLSLHDALPILQHVAQRVHERVDVLEDRRARGERREGLRGIPPQSLRVAVDEVRAREARGERALHRAELHRVGARLEEDRKSTRLNSSHVSISY